MSKSFEKSDMFSHLLSLRYMPRWAVMLLDLFICILSFAASLLIVHGLFTSDPNNPSLSAWQQLLFVVPVQLLCFWAFHTYSGILRYSTFIDTLKVLLSQMVAGVISILLNILASNVYGHRIFLYSTLVVYVFVSFTLLFILRVGTKTLFEHLLSTNYGSSKQRVFIYGTKQAGIAIAKMLRSSGDSEYKPIGFIDDDPKEKKNYTLVGLPVYNLNDELFIRMRRMGVKGVIISPLKMREIKPNRDLQIFIKHKIHVLTTPYFTDWDKTDKTPDTNHKLIGSIETIRVEDLLERDQIEISTENVRKIIQNHVVMVTGAAGSIGSELVRQILKYNPRTMILFEQAESPLHDLTLDLLNQYPNAQLIPCIGDVRDIHRVEEVMSELRPEVIYHAAAYKHVPLMENHPNEAIHANVLGTKNMADTAVKYGVKRFVMISTDKAVNPTNIMGASKRIAEIYVQSLFNHLKTQNENCTKFITTRFGNVLGSNGSVIPYFKKQIAAGGPVTVTHPDIIRFFMTIPEACNLVMEASTLGNGGEIFVFDMGRPVKIADLAENMIRLAGYEPNKDIEIVYTGLRPGEKLYEEVLNQQETTLPTPNKKIMIAKVREYDYEQVKNEVDELIQISRHTKPFLTVQQMKSIVPEYISRNSIYEKLDK